MAITLFEDLPELNDLDQVIDVEARVKLYWEDHRLHSEDCRQLRNCDPSQTWAQRVRLPSEWVDEHLWKPSVEVRSTDIVSKIPPNPTSHKSLDGISSSKVGTCGINLLQNESCPRSSSDLGI